MPLIREMRNDDYRGLVELWSEFPGNTMTGADRRAGFAEFLEGNSRYCFTALDDGRVVGSVMAGTDRRRGYVYHLAVAPKHQRRGLGIQLMKRVEESLATDGIEKAHLFIYADNPAIAFYQRAGWHLREDIEVMSKVLIGDEYMGTRRESE